MWKSALGLVDSSALIVPQHLLGYRDVARLLSGHFENISVRRFPDGEYGSGYILTDAL